LIGEYAATDPIRWVGAVAFLTRDRHRAVGNNNENYLTQGQPHYEVVLSVAIIAIARKVIILDLKEMDSMSLIGIASIVVALTAGYYLMKKGQSHAESTSSEY
jgi:hypothetical protein